MEAGFQCAACGEWNDIAVDESAARNQRYVEDCQVCCKPNLLFVIIERPSGDVRITAELES